MHLIYHLVMSVDSFQIIIIRVYDWCVYLSLSLSLSLSAIIHKPNVCAIKAW